MFKRILLVMLSMMLLAFFHRLFIDSDGLRSVWDLQKSLERQQQENSAMRQRNTALEAEVRDLKEGLAAIEELARSELGMIKQGEVFYQVTE